MRDAPVFPWEDRHSPPNPVLWPRSPKWNPPLANTPLLPKPAFIYISSQITCKLLCFFFLSSFFLKNSVISKKDALLEF